MDDTNTQPTDTAVTDPATAVVDPMAPVTPVVEPVVTDMPVAEPVIPTAEVPTEVPASETPATPTL